jgi:hypothetical protein
MRFRPPPDEVKADAAPTGLGSAIRQEEFGEHRRVMCSDFEQRHPTGRRNGRTPGSNSGSGPGRAGRPSEITRTT